MMDAGMNLIWLDLEMSGLQPERDVILEIAIIISDSDLNVVAEMPSIAIHQPESVFASMDDWNQKHHHASGLVARCRASKIELRTAEQSALNFVKQYVSEKSSPLCGNSIGQDRRFLQRYMPELEAYSHYRNLDVSTLKELAKRWYPDCVFHKQNQHEALADIRESLAELRFYRAQLFR